MNARKPFPSREEVAAMLEQTELEPDDGWTDVSIALTGTWRRNPNRGLRILRDYVGNGESRLRVTRVLAYLSGAAFLKGEIGNDQTDALREFCRRKFNRNAINGRQ